MKHWMGWLVGVACVAALGLVAYGALTHEEAGLLRACAGPDGRLEYAGQCFEVTWREPLPLRLHAAGGEPWQVGSLRDAADSIGSELHQRAFVMVDDVTKAQVLARFDVGSEVGAFSPAGRVQHWTTPGSSPGKQQVERCDVALSNLALGPMAAVTTRHELGHVLGLAHDDYTNSLMTGEPLDTDKYYALSDEDRNTLTRVYGRRATP